MCTKFQIRQQKQIKKILVSQKLQFLQHVCCAPQKHLCGPSAGCWKLANKRGGFLKTQAPVPQTEDEAQCEV